MSGSDGRAQQLVNAIVCDDGFMQVVNEPTHYLNLIDVFLMKPPQILNVCEVMPGVIRHIFGDLLQSKRCG